MTTIGLSSKSFDSSPSITEMLSSEGESIETITPKKRMSLFLIPSTIGLGLLMTFGYVGGRIFSASAGVPPVLHTVEIPPPPQPAAVTAPAAVQSKVNLPAAPAVQPAAEVSHAPLNLLTPRTGESYLQLAALPPKLAMEFIDDLKKINVDAGIAQGPSPDMVRVLAGPFATPDLMNKTKAKLDAQKLVSMVRDY